MAKESKNKEKKVKASKGKSNFMKDTKAELKKVIWPNPKQLFNNTFAVIIIVIIIGIIVFVLDVCFDKINSYGIDKLKEAVQSENEIVQEGSGDESLDSTGEDEGISENLEVDTDLENPDTTVVEETEEQTTTESETQGE